MLADYVSNSQKYAQISAHGQFALTNEDIEKVQKFSNKILRTHLKIDGKLGPKTKEAVKKLQAKAKMHEDGYPDYQLLKKIDNYNAKLGFNVPVQPKKKKRK